MIASANSYMLSRFCCCMVHEALGSSLVVQCAAKVGPAVGKYKFRAG